MSGGVVKDIRIEVDDEQYDHLDSVKRANGLTWRGMLILAADELEDG